MLPKKSRLTVKDFSSKNNLIFKGFSDFFSISVLDDAKNSQGCRFACVISSSATKNKPKRNKLRRQVYEVVKNLDFGCNNKKPLKIIIYPKKEAFSLDLPTIKVELNDLASKALQRLKVR